jgi:hypothetical protein
LSRNICTSDKVGVKFLISKSNIWKNNLDDDKK